ncbi:mCG113008, isoform CRA_b, partial [Mus musculus]
QTRHYKELKLKEKEIMTFLNDLEMENMEARENNQELKKEKNFYRSQKLQESWDWPQLKKTASCRRSCHARRPLLSTIPSTHHLPRMNLPQMNLLIAHVLSGNRPYRGSHG